MARVPVTIKEITALWNSGASYIIEFDDFDTMNTSIGIPGRCIFLNVVGDKAGLYIRSNSGTWVKVDK